MKGFSSYSSEGNDWYLSADKEVCSYWQERRVPFIIENIFSFFCGTIQNTLWTYFAEMCFFFFLQKCALMKINVPFPTGELCWGMECSSGLPFPSIKLSFILTTSWTPIATRAPGKSFSWLSCLNSLISIHIMKHLN